MSPEPTAPTRRPRWRRAVRVVFAVLVVAFLFIALRDQWAEVGQGLRDLSLAALGLGLAGVLVGVLATMMSWRALLTDLGSALPATAAIRVFSLGQLGKYLPGSVWSFVGQMEMATDHDVPRSRTAISGLLALALGVVMALVVAAVTLPFVLQGSAREYLWVLWLLPLGIVALHPRVLRTLLNTALRVVRRGPLEQTPTTRGLLISAAWSLLSWAGFGTHVWLLALDLGAPASASLLPLGIGAFSGAWAIGFLFIIAPAGAGVREAVLVLALSTVLPVPAATLVSLVSRVLVTLGDLVWAGAGLALSGPVRNRVRALQDRR